MTPADITSAGYVTGRSQLTDATGGIYEVVAISGTVTASKYSFTLDANIDPPQIQSTGANTVTTLMGFDITIVAGSGTPAAGDLITLHQPKWEPSIALSTVTMTSAGHYHCTAPIRFPHKAGQRGWEWAYGGQGFAFTANTSFAPGDASADPAGLPYFVEAVGATDASHVVLTKYVQGRLENMELNNGFGNVTMSSIGLDNIANTGGVATLTFYPQSGSNDSRINSYPIVTIRGSSIAGFNGQLANLRNFRYWGQGKYAVDADQASSTGLSAPYSDNAQLTFGTTSYGNTQYTMRPMLQMLDVQRYPAYPACYASGLSGCNPVVDGTIRLSATTMHPPTDGTGIIAAVHDYSMSVDYHDNYLNVGNPMAYGHHSDFQMNGAGVNSNFFSLRLGNGTSYTNFVGYGGDQSIPQAMPIGGLYTYHINAAMAPAWGGHAFHEGCPAVGCSNTLATFYQWDFDTLGGNGGLLVQPGLNLATFTSGTTWNVAGQLRVQGIPQYALAGSVVASASTIAIVNRVSHVSGTAAINTMTPPTACTTISPATTSGESGTSYACEITLIPDGAFTTTTAGNIAVALTATVGQPILATYDPGTTKWYPVYTSGGSSGSAELAVAYSSTPVLNPTYKLNTIALTGPMSPTIAAGTANQAKVCLRFVKSSTSATYAITYPTNLVGGGQPLSGYLYAKQCYDWTPSASRFETDGPMMNF